MSKKHEGIFLRDYNIREAQDILASCDPDSLKFDKHVLKNWFERDYKQEYVVECLLSKIPLSISKTTENRFKLIYPHENIKSKDFYIIISIDDYYNITVITAYVFDNYRRKRNVERE